MQRSFDRRNAMLAGVSAAIIVAVLVADILTPLGVAIWVFYLPAIAIAAFMSWSPAPLVLAFACSAATLIAAIFSPPVIGGFDLSIVLVNRTFGVVSFWTVGVLARSWIVANARLAGQNWIRGAQGRLGSAVQGEHNRTELGERILRVVCETIEAPAGALYIAEGDALQRLSSYRPATMPELGAARVSTGEGLLGDAVRSRRLAILDDPPADHLPVSSALGRSAPRQIVAVPAEVDGTAFGGLELALLRPLNALQRELLATLTEPIAIALRSILHRERLAELLSQTQQQAEELQVQQEELKVANEELENQSQVLRESQARLEGQQAELEQTNTQLEEQAQAIEHQRDELLRAQTALVERSDELGRASQYKSEFLANMSHELRTPLNSILILAKNLADNGDGNLSDEQARFGQTIYEAGNDLLQLINDILDLSRIEAGRMDLNREAVDVESTLQALNRIFRPLAEEKGLSLSMHRAPSVPASITTDGLRLQQILRNLISNAIKFTEAGSVRIDVSQLPGGRIAFAVEDTGPGIPEGKSELIFEAFRQADGTTQRRHGGSGLGLTISRQLARRLGADITLESTPGRGSKFTLVVPVRGEYEVAEPREESAHSAAQGMHAAAQSARTANNTDHAKPFARPAGLPSRPAAPPVNDDHSEMKAERPGSRRSVLIVEDDHRFAAILRDFAHEQGFQCVIATTAAEAMTLAEELHPSAVLLDVHLPDGSGLAVLERMKNHPTLRRLPVHVMSVGDYSRPALELGAIGYVLKPAGREQILDAFRRIEERLSRRVQRILVVEDSEVQRHSLVTMLQAEDVQVECAADAQQALERLRGEVFDCMVLDLGLQGESGFSLLEKMAGGESYSFPPVIVYTGRSLSRQEEDQLRRYASSIIIKGARSPERLLDEAMLFLHNVDADLPPGAQRQLRQVRGREAALEGRRILLAEDDVRNVFALSSMLERKGAQVLIARNGKEALSKLSEAEGDADASIDLALMDVMMPEMDGIEAMRRIRSREGWKKLPIIALTAKAMPDDRQKCLDAGASDYMAKPLDLDKLVSLIKVWMPK